MLNEDGGTGSNVSNGGDSRIRARTGQSSSSSSELNPRQMVVGILDDAAPRALIDTCWMLEEGGDEGLTLGVLMMWQGTLKPRHNTGRAGCTTGRTRHTTGRTRHTTGHTGRTTERAGRTTRRAGRTTKRAGHTTRRAGYITGRAGCITGRARRITGRTGRTTGHTGRTIGRTGRPFQCQSEASNNNYLFW